MKICILSKPEHAGPHAQALRELGHDVDVMDPKGSYPPSYDVYVCRNSSVSHQTSWDSADLREQGKIVIFENSKTKILAAVAKLTEEEKPMTYRDQINKLTIDQKASTAIDVFGVFNPVHTKQMSLHQIQEFHRLGLVGDVDMASDMVQALQSVPKGSWAAVWGQQKSNPTLFLDSFYKMGPAGNRVLVHLVSKRRHDKKKLDAAARILGLLTAEEAGKIVAASVPTPVLDTLQEEANVPLMQEEMASAVPEIPVTPEGSEAQLVPASVQPTAPVTVHTEPKPVSHKADIKELLGMLNEALLAINVTELSVIPTPAGPQVKFSQVVVRKVTSIDDLE